MPTDATFLRLLAVLEDFAARESVLLGTGDIATVRELQERAAPLLDELARLGRSPVSPDAQARVAALLARRLRNQEQVGEQLGHVRAALERTQINLRNVGRIAPVYGRQAMSARDLVPGATHAVA